MSIESAKTFIDRMRTDEDFAKQVRKFANAEERMAFAKAAGFDFTAEELENVTVELTEGMMDNVVGGYGIYGCDVIYYRDGSEKHFS